MSTGKRASTRDWEQFVVADTRCQCGKLRYTSKAAAKKALSRMKGRSGRMQPYRCQGDFWHLGHPPRDLVRGEVTRDDVEARRFDR